MKKAYVFPGQGAQFPGMAKDIYDSSDVARNMLEQANDILGFRITDVMFNGTEEELKQTRVTQPAIFLHSVALSNVLGSTFSPDMVAGHSLGEFSALVSVGAMSFEDGLRLVSSRAQAMQRACELNPSTMAAILGLEDEVVEKTCEEIEGVVVAANYNCPGQLVISGSIEAVNAACTLLTERGAKRALVLQVGGAFHSPLMQPALDELKGAIEQTAFQVPRCAVYQNVDAQATVSPEVIKEKLVQQLTAPVRWTQIMQNMLADGCGEVIEVGPGKVLQGLFKKVDRNLIVSSAGVEV
ncbi:MAG: [acyl-carrier-protein] S-malonyltransferase [Bacteroidota bacterium]|jgi:[acyl-carrier-protein] S-malonyltransferase